MDALIEKIEQNGGYITKKDLTRAEYEKVLRGLKNGTIHKLKNGLYYLEDYLYDLIKDTDALIPDGVLCMWSAWYFYDRHRSGLYLHSSETIQSSQTSGIPKNQIVL